MWPCYLSESKKRTSLMKEELLDILFYTLAGLIFLSVLVTVLILFLPYYLGKEFIQFFKNKKERNHGT